MSRVTVTAAAVGAAVGEGALPVGGACVAGIDDGGVESAADGDGGALLGDEQPASTSAATHSVGTGWIMRANVLRLIPRPPEASSDARPDARPCACRP